MKKECSVAHCGRNASAKGWCNRHYQRWMRHGDPLAGKTFEGEPKKFLDRALLSDTDECIFWPFSGNDRGYPKIVLNGTWTYAHREVCRRAHGEPASPDLEAAHSCGNGHLGCINKRHLRWATHLENIADKYREELV